MKKCIICGEPMPLRERERRLRVVKRELDYLKSDKSKNNDSPKKRLNIAKRIRERVQIIVDSDFDFITPAQP